MPQITYRNSHKGLADKMNRLEKPVLNFNRKNPL